MLDEAFRSASGVVNVQPCNQADVSVQGAVFVDGEVLHACFPLGCTIHEAPFMPTIASV